VNMELESVVGPGEAQAAIGVGGRVDGGFLGQALKGVADVLSQKGAGGHDTGIAPNRRILLPHCAQGHSNQLIGIVIKIVDYDVSVQHVRTVSRSLSPGPWQDGKQILACQDEENGGPEMKKGLTLLPGP